MDGDWTHTGLPNNSVLKKNKNIALGSEIGLQMVRKKENCWERQSYK